MFGTCGEVHSAALGLGYQFMASGFRAGIDFAASHFTGKVDTTHNDMTLIQRPHRASRPKLGTKTV